MTSILPHDATRKRAFFAVRWSLTVSVCPTMIFISRELISLALLDWSEVDSDAVYSVVIIFTFSFNF